MSYSHTFAARQMSSLLAAEAVAEGDLEWDNGASLNFDWKFSQLQRGSAFLSSSGAPQRVALEVAEAVVSEADDDLTWHPVLLTAACHAPEGEAEGALAQLEGTLQHLFGQAFAATTPGLSFQPDAIAEITKARFHG